MQALAKALVAARRHFKPIARSRTVTVKSQRTGGSFSYSYAPMDAVLEATTGALADAGIVVLQPVCNADGGSKVIRTIILHESGESMQTEVDVPWASDPQDVGKAITYLRRYAYVSALGLATEEDDDASDSPRAVAAEKSEARPAAPPAKTDDDEMTLRRRMFAAFDRARLGVGQADSFKMHGKERDELLRGIRLKWVADQIGHAVASTAEMTPAEVAAVTAALDGLAAERAKEGTP